MEAAVAVFHLRPGPDKITLGQEKLQLTVLLWVLGQSLGAIGTLVHSLVRLPWKSRTWKKLLRSCLDRKRPCVDTACHELLLAGVLGPGVSFAGPRKGKGVVLVASGLVPRVPFLLRLFLSLHPF